MSFYCAVLRITHTLAFLFSTTIPPTSFAQTDGALPIPVLNNVGVSSSVTYDASTNRYTYRYTVTNPGGNTGDIDAIHIDVSMPQNAKVTFNTEGYNIPYGISNLTFPEALDTLTGFKQKPVIPFGLTVPTGWAGAVGAAGIAAYFSGDAPSLGSSDKILPGETQGGFSLISEGVPTLRKIVFVPDWIYVSTDPEGTSDEEGERSREIDAAIRYSTETLGPAAVRFGAFEHWDQLRNDLDKSIQNGWVPDATLANVLRNQLASAREALEALDGTLAKSRLQELQITINQSNANQRRSEVFDLVTLNIQKLQQFTKDVPNQ